MTQQDGIDLARSGWDNPENFQPRARERAPQSATQLPPVCGAEHPDGWTCEKTPGHPNPDSHYADNGEPGGLRWNQNWAEVTTIGEREPSFIRSTVETLTPLAEVGALAEKALASDRPSDWAVALDAIRRLCR